MRTSLRFSVRYPPSCVPEHQRCPCPWRIASGPASGKISFTPCRWVSACGFVPAGRPLPTLKRSIYCSTRVLPLVRVPTRPQPCVCARWMRIFRLANAWWITAVVRAFSGLPRRAWARRRCWVSITTPRRSRRVGIMHSATRCRTPLFLLCSPRITWWQTGKLRPTG